ncbi:Uncharacterised protein [Acinetobacter baumannii]|nr:Uncharacterised protein [Acinetobacter baumannii]SST06487.1 Uncharacterised protein [Acinetobacter baumannii]
MLWLNTSGGHSVIMRKAISIRPRKSGTKISSNVFGLSARASLIQSTKCCAPPSSKSSRSTEVITAYLSLRLAIVSAMWRGSSGSNAFGRPCATSQKGQRRVQISPMIMNVAVPPPKHSGRLGQAASSQTVWSF